MSQDSYNCPHCGLPYTDHTGLIGTCRDLHRAEAQRNDYRGMASLLAASLKRVNSKYGHNEDGTPSDWNPWVEAREIIKQAEVMLKENQ